jgi:hypothetical protein
LILSTTLATHIQCHPGRRPAAGKPLVLLKKTLIFCLLPYGRPERMWGLLVGRWSLCLFYVLYRVVCSQLPLQKNNCRTRTSGARRFCKIWYSR